MWMLFTLFSFSGQGICSWILMPSCLHDGFSGTTELWCDYVNFLLAISDGASVAFGPYDFDLLMLLSCRWFVDGVPSLHLQRHCKETTIVLIQHSEVDFQGIICVLVFGFGMFQTLPSAQISISWIQFGGRTCTVVIWCYLHAPSSSWDETYQSWKSPAQHNCGLNLLPENKQPSSTTKGSDFDELRNDWHWGLEGQRSEPKYGPALFSRHISVEIHAGTVDYCNFFGVVVLNLRPEKNHDIKTKRWLYMFVRYE